jgi:hypothetical protein
MLDQGNAAIGVEGALKLNSVVLQLPPHATVDKRIVDMHHERTRKYYQTPHNELETIASHIIKQ